MEKDFLQSLKIDISRNFKMVPYERIAFHKILGLMKTENGMNTLLKEIKSEKEIRESALLQLKDYDRPELMPLFLELLHNPGLDNNEKLYVLEHIGKNGDEQSTENIIRFIKENTGEKANKEIVAKAFDVLRMLGKGVPAIESYFNQIASNREIDKDIRGYAILGLSSFKNISTYEELLREQDDAIAFNVFKSLSMMSDNFYSEVEHSSEDDEVPFTYSQDLEDKLMLDIRVLLGKMTSNYDSYSQKTKTAFISSMISTNHRELLIYVMKALTSNDSELVDMILHQILSDVLKLKDHDKLFRNLLALTADTDRKNNTIVSIIESYFINMKETRKNILFRDKLYNYIIVTLDTYFETYRKEFMVTEVAEKGFPESFQNIRRYILEHLNPDMRKRILHFLKNGDRTTLKSLLKDFSQRVTYIDQLHKEQITFLLEILYDEDQKSRENSIGRIEDINFEKRYLRNRILRICEIIGRLGIDEAATSLVKIYNYVKKYPDEDISNAVTYCLSMLNYSYLQGELEVMLTSGDELEQDKAIQYLSLFADQRSMNILLDYIRDNTDIPFKRIEKIFNILLRRDMFNNMAANSTFKHYIESESNEEIRRLATLCLGKCGLEGDIEYLNSLFLKSPTTRSRRQFYRH